MSPKGPLRRPRGSLEDVCVVLPAGGKGERLASLKQARGRNKAAVKVAGKSLIERTVEMYAAAGARRFVVLVNFRPESVKHVLGDGRRWRSTVLYAKDPPRPVGKGGAIRLAMERGLIPAGATAVIHNPDDQIIGLGARFARSILAQHFAAARRGAQATAVCVPDTEYPYTAFRVSGGMARRAEMYPRVRMPTHIGVTVVAPSARPAFVRLIDLGKKVDFESVVLPYLARRGRLGIATIPAGSWIPVNDPKSYGKLEKALGA